MSLFDELDIEKTKVAAHTVLSEYRRLKMIARRPIQQKITVSYDSQPTSKSDVTPAIERAVVMKEYAAYEVERIEAAINSLSKKDYVEILELIYLDGYEKTDLEMCERMECSSSTFYRKRNKALVQIAEALGCEVVTSIVPRGY
ncbi:ArpU family phage packaging/lysis transcriptional regulator [Carnobacterium divergens]|uniref:ArpU family phage packaging/lysis transcriptional regulator n=1 Tax=Carnobacterium divergens TaxID=2748 RepID=UPI0039C99734